MVFDKETVNSEFPSRNIESMLAEGPINEIESVEVKIKTSKKMEIWP